MVCMVLIAETVQREPLCAAGFNVHFSAFTELFIACVHVVVNSLLRTVQKA